MPNYGMDKHEIVEQQVKGRGENYRAFLLRCWQENEVEPGRQPVWRFTLVQVGGKGKKGFACLEELVEYLREELCNR